MAGILASLFLVATALPGGPPQNFQRLLRQEHFLDLPGERIGFTLQSTDDIAVLMQAVHGYLSRSESFPEKISKRNRRGLEEIIRLGHLAMQSAPGEDRWGALKLLLEAAYAVRNNQRSPAPESLDFLQVPFALLDHLYAPMAKGRMPPSNLSRPGPDHLGLIDPASSTFWQRRDSVQTLDLYRGFGREQMFGAERYLWRYDKPKDSYGGNAGFEVQHGEMELKIKFGEVHSEPLAARFFHAVGYHADATDYAAGLNVLYDRRILSEFNSRKPIVTRFKVFGFLPVYELDLQEYKDPFNYIAWVELRDGRRISSEEFRKRLLKATGEPHPELNSKNFRTDFEGQVHFLRTREANIQLDDPAVKSIGPWDFGELGHQHLRELRGAGLLAAWLGWCDSRFENTRLKRVEHGGRIALVHYFSDLGGGLGRNPGFISWEGELPNQFPWTFTRRWPLRPDLPPHPSFRVVHFRPIEDTLAFRQMTLGDARWMARLIAQFDESQIVSALIASGFDAAETKLYTRKLISRRDKFIMDLELDNEIELMCGENAKRHFDYDPIAEGCIKVILPDGSEVESHASFQIIRDGLLCTRDVNPANGSETIEESPSVPAWQCDP